MTKGLTIKIAKGSITTIVVTILLSALFWFLPLLFLNEKTAQVPILFMGIEILSLPTWLSKLFAFIYWGIVWYLLNMICNGQNIIPASSEMIFILGMAFSATVPLLQQFDGTLIAFLLFLVFFISTYRLSGVTNQVKETYNIVLIILLSSFFVQGYIWLIGILFLGFIIFEVNSFRINISIITAILTIAWLTYGICFCLGQTALLTAWVNSLLLFSIPSFHGWSTALIGSILLFLAVITVIVALNSISHHLNARDRQNCSFFNMAFFFTSTLAIFFPSGWNGMLLVLIFIATVLSALYFSVAKSKFADILFFVFIGLMIIFRVSTELDFPKIINSIPPVEKWPTPSLSDFSFF